MTKEIRYPEITVSLIGGDGNAYAILGKVTRALKRDGVPEHVVKEYQSEAMSGDYNHLLLTTMKWVNVE